MNFLTPVSQEWLDNNTRQAPATLQPGMRLPESALKTCLEYTREQLRTQGIEVGPCDPSRQLKGWIIPDATEAMTLYFLDKSGGYSLTLSAEELRTFNLANEPKWPIPDRENPPSKVRFVTNDRSGIIPAYQLSTRAEADRMLTDLGDMFEVISPEEASAGKTQIIRDPNDPRSPGVLYHQPTRQTFPIGVLYQELFIKGAKGAAGKWVYGETGVIYQKDVIYTTSPKGILPAPIAGPLPAGAVIESAGPTAGGVLQVYLPEPPPPPSDASILEEIRADVKEILARSGGTSGVPWL